MPDEVKIILDRLALESAISLEGLLQRFRDICGSEDEFKRRTWCEQREGMPNFTQYLFDGNPVFYTEFQIKDNCISYLFHHGSMYDSQ